MVLALVLLALALQLSGAPPAAAGAAPVARGGNSLPLALDLIALALHGGQPVDRALVAAAPAAGPHAEAFRHVARLLALGADPAEAWSAVCDDPSLVPIAAAARRSARSGARLAGAFETLARELRAHSRSRSTSRAHRVGVLVAAPLGLCFLPSFVCLGIIPTLLGLARSALT